MRSFLPCLLLCAAAMILPVAHASAADFEVRTEENVFDGKRVEQKYTANKFYSTYYIYMNVIRATGVEKHLSSDEIGRVIDEMIAGLKKNGMAQLVVLGYPGAGDLRVTLRIATSKKNDKPILLLVSNYDPNTKEVLDSGDMSSVYATYFFMVGDKLVKYQLVADAEEKKRDAQKSINNLADYYLLDADRGNDAKGKAMLIDGLKKLKDDEDRFIMNLTLSEYYLLENDPRDARKVLDEAKRIAGSVSDKKKSQELISIYPYADDLYRYMVNGKSD